MSDADEFAKVRAERDAFLRELLSMRQTLDELTKLVAHQNDRLDEVVSMLRRRESQLKRAEREVRKLRKKLGLDPEPEPDPEPPPAPPSSPTSPADEASGGPSSEVGDASDAPPTGRKKRKDRKPRSSAGRRPPPEHLPSDEESHTVCACAQCGAADLWKKDVRTTRKYDVVPSYVRTRVIHRERVICAGCGSATTAAMPPMPCDRAGYTCRFVAWLVVMKFVLLVPLDRIHLLLASQGVHIAKGTLVHLIERAATLADAVDGEHWKQLRAGAVIAFDGTGLKTLVLGQPKAWDGYLEVFTRDELTVFQFDLTKHADRLRARLDGYVGMLQCDAESRNIAGANSGATFGFCNAHPKRAFEAAEKSHPRRAAQGGRFLSAMYDLEHIAEDQQLTGEALVAFRQRRTRRIFRRFRDWLRRVVELHPLISDPLRQVSQYYLNHFDNLTRFVDHAELAPDNNASEREFQRHAKLRFASLFAGSVEGGHRWATLLGVVRTAQKCDVDVLAYLTWMFERRGTHRKQFNIPASDLTPMAYRDLVGQQRQAA